MSTNRPKNSYDWMKIVQFSIFCISCIAMIIIWYYSNLQDINVEAEKKYVSKPEIQLIEQRIETNEQQIKDIRNEFSQKLEKLEGTNNEIVDLITDIRLTLARGGLRDE